MFKGQNLIKCLIVICNHSYRFYFLCNACAQKVLRHFCDAIDAALGMNPHNDYLIFLKSGTDTNKLTNTHTSKQVNSTHT